MSNEDWWNYGFIVKKNNCGEHYTIIFTLRSIKYGEEETFLLITKEELERIRDKLKLFEDSDLPKYLFHKSSYQEIIKVLKEERIKVPDFYVKFLEIK